MRFWGAIIEYFNEEEEIITKVKFLLERGVIATLSALNVCIERNFKRVFNLLLHSVDLHEEDGETSIGEKLIRASLQRATPINNYYFKVLYKAIGGKISDDSLHSIVESYCSHYYHDLRILKLIVKNNAEVVVRYLATDDNDMLAAIRRVSNNLLKVLVSVISPNYDKQTIRSLRYNLETLLETADEECKTIINDALMTLSRKEQTMRITALVFKKPLIEKRFHPDVYLKLLKVPSKVITRRHSANPEADKIRVKSRQYRSAPSDLVKMSSRNVR